MYFAAWQVQNVAGLELQVDRRRKVFDSNGFVLLALYLARRYVGALVDVPGLGSLDLQDQDVVVVVVRNESLRSGRSDVGVDLDREIQLDLDGLRQRGNGADVALNAVQNDGVAVGKVVADADKIKSAIVKPVAVRALFVRLPHP